MRAKIDILHVVGSLVMLCMAVIIGILFMDRGTIREEFKQTVDQLEAEKLEYQNLLQMKEKKIEELESENERWKEAAQPITSIFRGDLFYLGLSEESLLYDLKPENLSLALRPCRWLNRERSCEKYAPGNDVPIHIVVLDPEPE